MTWDYDYEVQTVYTSWKVSIFGVFLVRIQSKCGKIWTRKTPNTDTFHAVLYIILIFYFPIIVFICLYHYYYYYYYYYYYVKIYSKRWKCILLVVFILYKIKFGHGQISVSRIGIAMSITVCINPCLFLQWWPRDRFQIRRNISI